MSSEIFSIFWLLQEKTALRNIQYQAQIRKISSNGVFDKLIRAFAKKVSSEYFLYVCVSTNMYLMKPYFDFYIGINILEKFLHF